MRGIEGELNGIKTKLMKNVLKVLTCRHIQDKIKVSNMSKHRNDTDDTNEGG